MGDPDGIPVLAEQASLPGFPDPPFRRRFAHLVGVHDVPDPGIPPVPPHDRHLGSSRVDLQACKLEYSIVSPK